MTDRGLGYTVWLPPEDFFIALDRRGWEEELTDSEAKLRYGYGFFAMMLEGYRYNVVHADELAAENPDDVIHSQGAGDVDYMAAWVECGDCTSSLVGTF
jgi:hypothetical protein